MLLQNLQAELAEAIKTNDQTTNIIIPAKHISIYHHQVFFNLTKALFNIYPLITKLLGEDFFQITAKAYIKQYPATSSNLHDYGEYFSDFITNYPPVKNLTYLAEVAQFEWICHALLFAAEHSKLNIDTLANFTPEQYDNLHLVLHPASELMKFHYPILRIIDLCKGEINEEVDISEGNVNLLIIKRELEIILVPLSLTDYIFLKALQKGETLSQAVNAAIENDPQFKLEDKLLNWVIDQTIVEVYLENSI